MSTKDTSGSTPQHSHPHNNTMSRNEKFWVDQVTVPQPPPGNDKGWGTTRGGGGAEGKGGRGAGVRHLFQLPACSPFLDLETSVPLRLEIVPLGSGQHG